MFAIFLTPMTGPLLSVLQDSTVVVFLTLGEIKYRKTQQEKHD